MAGEPAAPTLRCPHCGSADLHFRSAELVQCSRCRRKFSPRELSRARGTPGHHSDKDRWGRH